MTATDQPSAAEAAESGELPASGRPLSVGAAERVTYGLLFLVLAAIVLLNSRGVFTPDIKPEVYLNPLRRLVYDLSAWQADPQMGVGNYNNGLAPVSAVTTLMREMGLGPEATVKLLRLFLLTVGAWGAVRLLRLVSGDGNNAVARVTMAVVFVLNPYAVTAGATLAVLLPYAVLPWQLYALARAVESGRGWRWPAVFAITIFAMTGMNVAAVPLLQLVATVPALLLWARLALHTPFRAILLGVAKSVLLSLLVSLYWLLPALNGFGWGSTVASNSETLAGIAAPSSFAEVLRGLGLWPLYGRDPVSGPWQPGFTVYLDDPFVIIASFGLVAMAAASALLIRSRGRLLAVLFLAVAAVIMVGLHPPDHPSPAGLVMQWFFDNVPGGVALRTTNKAGGGLAIGLALLIALAAGAVASRVRDDGPRIALVGAVTVVLVGASLPAFTGNLYVGRWDIPQYWDDAAKALDNGNQNSRLWLVPGQVLAHYRWSTEGPDDVSLALFNRPTLLRTLLPVPSAETTNLLAGADSALQAGQLPGNGVSALAHYLGVDQVLLRNDVVWEDARGGRPAVVQPEVANDPGLRLVTSYGKPGQNTVSSIAGTGADDLKETNLQPLQVYSVAGSPTIVRTESEGGQLLVAGDGFAVPELVAAGLLSGSESFRYLGDMARSTFAQLLSPDRRLVLTDSNQRRAADSHHLTDAYGPLLSADQVPESTRALFGAGEQTVARYEGVHSITATSFGSPFDVSPRGAPALAFDGNMSTGWTFGSFGTALRDKLTVRFVSPRSVGSVTIRTGEQPGPVRITRVSVSAGGITKAATLDADGNATLTFPGVVADRFTAAVTATSGEGINEVRVAEIESLGLAVTKVARMPLTLDRLAAGLDYLGRQRLDQTPLDVVMTRSQPTDPSALEEPTLLRDFTLPDSRSFDPTGLAQPTGTVPAPDADGCTTVAVLDGVPLRVRLGTASGPTLRFNDCGTLQLGAGEHSLRAVDGWVLDSLALRDVQGLQHAPHDPTPTVSVARPDQTSMTVHIDRANNPYLLVLGQSTDPGWRATLDGRPMGSPITVDGYSAGWRISDPGPHVGPTVVRAPVCRRRGRGWRRERRC